MIKTAETKLRAEIDHWKKMVEELRVVEVLDAKAPPRPPCRAKPPDTRASYTVKFKLYDSADSTKPPKLIKGWFTVGLYEDGSPCEIFIYFDRPGSKMRGFADTTAIFASMLFQVGVPLERVAEKVVGGRFQPAGMTGDPNQPTCTSLFDYIFRYMLRKHAPKAAAAT